MKAFIKNKFPGLHNLLKYMYMASPHYKNKIAGIEKINELNRINQNAEEIAIMESVFNNQYVVQNGHFKGMRYIGRSSGSALLPKILGSYEEPIQSWVKEVVDSKDYSNILDIGCAEGYYACGFAMRLPNTKIIAYDIDPEARKNSMELKNINELDNVEVKAECTHEELNEKCKAGVLVFCDVEGFEDVLLDPVKVPNLKNVDLIIESHDCFVPGITDTLISRFYMTHVIRIIVDYPYRIKEYQIPGKYTRTQFDEMTNERRPHFMKFIYMESIGGKA